ncbi:DUF3290 domain-containing protein [Pectinatus cerevisiiphilus]|uniref:Uncharacterized protein DUF3290 n=1 Tax=Pectinatus cerevisiiphilus TaxID=86956 RepID=A0A4R3K8A0_9FIRM|nr:DUF3290 domain-containing protein [Pectinatus cerevisiiphilus]TCS79013.1 uncharacterized protein DUF3290 [Pectinatus cerevisiiphilus]
MEFYTYKFIENQAQINHVFEYVISFFVLSGFFFAGVKYMRDRLKTKNRDLFIIFVLLIILVIGFRFTDYKQSQTDAEQTSQMIAFLKSVAEENHVSKDIISADSPRIKNEMIICIGDSFYQVNFFSNYSAYELKSISIINSNIRFIDK